MTRIGFIGVGTMGLPMAKNLVNNGFAVTAYDTNAEAARAAASAGMTAAASAAEAVATADLVITMLPSSPHAESVYTGDGGVLAAARKGTLCVDMSTIDPSVSRRIAAAATERGVRFMDAPVSGGVPRAAEGTLAIMVGGAQDDFDEALPALSAMGANVIRVGPVGSGEVVKLCNNLIAGVAAVAISEAFRIADGFGVDPKVVTQVISKSSGHTWVMEHMHPVPGLSPKAASSNAYQPGFMTDLMCKDLGLAVDAARALRVPVFVAPAAQQLYRLASSQGLGRKDFTSVYTLLKPSADTAPV
jgi:3-hydroxyisobutyrate dehydrogenase